MNIEEEIKLLERKLELLKQIKELQDTFEKQSRYVPYPVYPSQPWWNPPVLYRTYTTGGAAIEDLDPKYSKVVDKYFWELM